MGHVVTYFMTGSDFKKVFFKGQIDFILLLTETGLTNPTIINGDIPKNFILRISSVNRTFGLSLTKLSIDLKWPFQNCNTMNDKPTIRKNVHMYCMLLRNIHIWNMVICPLVDLKNLFTF